MFLQHVPADSQNVKGFFNFISVIQLNLAKSSCGWSPVWLHKKLGGKEKKKNPATHNPLAFDSKQLPTFKVQTKGNLKNILPYPKIRQMNCKNNVPKS